MSKNNKKNIFSFVLSFFIGILDEVYIFAYYISLGLFEFFDLIVATIFTIFSSLYYGLEFILRYIYKFFKIFIWDTFIIEIYNLFISFFLGLYYIIKFIFYNIPLLIWKNIQKIFNRIQNRFKTSTELASQSFKSLPDKIKSYFKEKYNNLSIVKYYRNKKIRNLEILSIDITGKESERSETKHAYEYLVRDKEGKLVKGHFMALSKLDTHSYLLDEGYEVYEIKTNAWIDFIYGDSFFGKRKMKNKDLIFWLAQLSTYVKSGVTLTESVKILAQQNKNRSYKKSFDAMIYELTMGESFSEALRKQGDMFPALLINMVKAAEKIGDIETTLDEMSSYYSEMEKNKKAIISAMTYPSIIFVFAIVVVIFIMAFIIPQFVDVYNSLSIELNAFTQLIINGSNFLVKKWVYLLLAVVGIVIIFKVLYDKAKGFKTVIQYFNMHLPVIGKIIIYNEMTRFSKTFAALNKNNVLLTESIDILSKITNNEIYKMIMFDTISNLLRGDKMSKSFKNNWAIPELAYYMISTGESTGELSEMLEKVANYYQAQQKNITNQLKTFVEPIMIAFLAIVVGGIILAIIIPIFELYQNIS